MGCSSTREKIEEIMMIYKLERMQIQMEKEKELQRLTEIVGHSIKRNTIPDYIDPEFAKEKKINEGYLDDDKPKKKVKNKNKSSKKKKEKIKL